MDQSSWRMEIRDDHDGFLKFSGSSEVQNLSDYNSEKDAVEDFQDYMRAICECLASDSDSSSVASQSFSLKEDRLREFSGQHDLMPEIVDQETKLLKGVPKEVEYIRLELQPIMAFLRAAEVIEEPSPQLSAWISEVRDTTFEIEDALDEFRIQLQQHGWYAMLTRFFKSVKYRLKIASKLRSIKTKIVNASEFVKASERLDSYKLDVPEQVASFTASNNLWNEERRNALLLVEAELVGIDKPKWQMMRWLVEEDPVFKVISVVGMGGLGKTTLVKKVYDDAIVQKHFNNHAWITVSQSFKIEDLLKDIIRQLFNESRQATPPGIETMKSQELKDTIKKFLQDSRYLVVLDDVWQVDAWEAIKYALPRSEHGNRVMLTTRNQGVADASSLADCLLKCVGNCFVERRSRSKSALYF